MFKNYEQLIKDCKTQREKVITLLKDDWHSGFSLNSIIKSTGGAPRAVELKTRPHLGYKIIERKHANGECNEYRLVKEEIHIEVEPKQKSFFSLPDWISR